MIYLCFFFYFVEGNSCGFFVDEWWLFVVCCDGCVYIYLNCCLYCGILLEWQFDVFFDDSVSLICCVSYGVLFFIEFGECVVGFCVGECLCVLFCWEDVEGFWVELDD